MRSGDAGRYGPRPGVPQGHRSGFRDFGLRASPCRGHCGSRHGVTMNIDWNAFTPYASLAGGALIGVAAALLVLLNGRIAGISGVLGGLLQPVKGDVSWRVAFVVGLVAAPAVYGLFTSLPALHVDASWGGLVIAGLLVGVGTRYASGCTSGHGVCG